MNERTTVRLPAELLRRAKRKAADEGRTLTSLIEDGLWRVIEKDSQAATQERIMPRVSTAKGPPFPGIDISDSAALQEMEDLDYAKRLKNGFK